MLPDNITQLIVVLLAPASAGAAASWLAEKVPFFQRQSAGVKAAMFPIIAALFGGVAMGLKIAVEGSPGTTVELLDVLYLGGMTLVLALLGSQLWHEKFNQVKKSLDTLPGLLQRAGADDNLIAFARLMNAVTQALSAEEEAAREGGTSPGGVPRAF